MEAIVLREDISPATKAALADLKVEEATAELAEAGEEQQNFFMLLHELNRLENDPKATREQLEQANAKVRAKADAIKIRLSKLEAEAARLNAIHQEFGAAKAAAVNSAARLEDWARHCLIYHNRPKVQGDRFEFIISEADAGLVGMDKYTLDAKLRLKYPNYIDVSYSFKNREIQAAIKEGKKDVPPELKIGKSQRFSIKVRKATK